MNKLLIKTLITIFIFLLLINCSDDTYEISSQEGRSLKKEISFEQFKFKTGLKDFKNTITIPLITSENGKLLTDNKDIINDFKIDTLYIKQTIIQNKTTYSFKIKPKIITDKSIFNLIVYNNNGIWETSIIELIPTVQNFENLISGATTTFKGKIKLIYKSNKNISSDKQSISRTSRTGCSTVFIGYQHCTGTGKCASGSCDGCNLCVDYDSFRVCEASKPVDAIVEAPGGSTGGGGGDSGLNLTDPSGYFFEPNLYDITDSESFAILQRTMMAASFWAELPYTAKEWAVANPDQYNTVLNFYLVDFSEENKDFANELINLAKVETYQEDTSQLINMSLLLEQNSDRIFEDDFIASLDPYIYIDLANTPPGMYNLFGVKIFLDYQKIRKLHPDWTTGKCLWYASKEIIHISLDTFGLIPVLGEVADLTNGVLYTIEGDGLNATLSYASAVPVAGWAAVGVKYAVKVKTAYGMSNRVKLVWKVLADGTVYFGTNNTCRAQLRKALGLVVGNLNQAHHIIPLNLQKNEIVQKAFKSADAFHLNEALNGIPLSTAVHNGSHFEYDKIIKRYLDAVPTNASPKECYDAVESIINRVRIEIRNNPNTPINQLIF